MSQQEANQDYINKKVDPILEKLVVDLLLNKPEDVVEFMIEWLSSKKDKLKKEIGIVGGSSPKRKGSISDDDDDDVLDLPVPVPNKKGARTSVSAEAYGLWNKKGAYVPKVIAKSEEIKKKIRKRLEEAFMFSALDEKEKEIVINAMEEKRFRSGDTIIKQGDDGDTLYLVESGQCDCFKKFKDAPEPKHLKVYNPGESFGELALLYNAPRAATIKAKSDCILYSLDRDCFNNIVKDAAMRKRERYEGFLANVELLQAMDPYERSNIADALKPEKFKAGEYVVKQGEMGTTFYFIEEGNAVATKTMKAGEPAVEVFQYKEGDYFGELALLKNVSRQANVIAKTNLSVVKLDRDSFARMMGPLEDILRRNMVRYEKYM